MPGPAGAVHRSLGKCYGEYPYRLSNWVVARGKATRLQGTSHVQPARSHPPGGQLPVLASSGEKVYRVDENPDDQDLTAVTSRGSPLSDAVVEPQYWEHQDADEQHQPREQHGILKSTRGLPLPRKHCSDDRHGDPGGGCHVAAHTAVKPVCSSAFFIV